MLLGPALKMRIVFGGGPARCPQYYELAGHVHRSFEVSHLKCPSASVPSFKFYFSISYNLCFSDLLRHAGMGVATFHFA
jgi:hypothetical protein